MDKKDLQIRPSSKTKVSTSSGKPTLPSKAKKTPKKKKKQQLVTHLVAQKTKLTAQRQMGAPSGAPKLSAGSTQGSKPLAMRKGMVKGVDASGLSRCAMLYGKALVNTFGEFDELPCIPDQVPSSSYRFRNLVRGTFSGQSSNNCAMIMYAPTWCANDTDAGGNNPIVASSVSSSCAANSFVPSGATTNYKKSSLPFPFAAFNLAEGIEGRVVGSALRIRYVGAPLYMSGEVIACRMTNGLGALNGRSPQENLNDPQSVITRVTDKWQTISWIPRNAFDLDFLGGGVDGDLQDPEWSIGFLITGLTPNGGFPFEFEIVEFFEFIGSGTDGDGNVYTLPEALVSHSDPVGLARVLNGMQEVPLDLDIRTSARAAATAIAEAIEHSDTVSKTIETVMGLAGGLLQDAPKLVSALVSSFLA